MRRNYFEICQKCGAHLDPGERCDCEEVITHHKAPIAGSTRFIREGQEQLLSRKDAAAHRKGYVL